MPNGDGMRIGSWVIDEIHWNTLDMASYYPKYIFKYDTKGTFKFELKESNILILTKCVDCAYCIKLGDGEWRCKYGIHGGKPEKETCNYERKKR